MKDLMQKVKAFVTFDFPYSQPTLMQNLQKHTRNINWRFQSGA